MKKIVMGFCGLVLSASTFAHNVTDYEQMNRKNLPADQNESSEMYKTYIQNSVALSKDSLPGVVEFLSPLEKSIEQFNPKNEMKLSEFFAGSVISKGGETKTYEQLEKEGYAVPNKLVALAPTASNDLLFFLLSDAYMNQSVKNNKYQKMLSEAYKTELDNTCVNTACKTYVVTDKLAGFIVSDMDKKKTYKALNKDKPGRNTEIKKITIIPLYMKEISVVSGLNVTPVIYRVETNDFTYTSLVMTSIVSPVFLDKGAVFEHDKKTEDFKISISEKTTEYMDVSKVMNIISYIYIDLEKELVENWNFREVKK